MLKYGYLMGIILGLCLMSQIQAQSVHFSRKGVEPPFHHVELIKPIACADASLGLTWTSNSQALVAYGDLCDRIVSYQRYKFPQSTFVADAPQNVYVDIATPITDKMYMVAGDGHIYRYPIAGGPAELVTIPYTSATSSTQQLVPDVIELRLSADESKLFYQTVRAYDNSSGDFYPYYDLHSVDTASKEDRIINEPLGVFRNEYIISRSGVAAWVGFRANGVYVSSHTMSPSLALESPANIVADMSLSDSLLIGRYATQINSDPAIYRYDVATQQLTLLFEGSSIVSKISPDEQWLLVGNNDDEYFRVNSVTGESTLIPFSLTNYYSIFFDGAKLIYHDATHLYSYDFATEQITTLFEDTSPEYSYVFQSNHAGTAILITTAISRADYPYTCDTSLEYLDLNTNSLTPIYTLPNPEPDCYGISPEFSPDDSMIAFTVYNFQTYDQSLHVLVKSLENVVSQSFIPMMSR